MDAGWKPSWRGRGMAGLGLVVLLGGTGCSSGSMAGLGNVLQQAGLQGSSGLSEGTIAAGLREALLVGIETAVRETSRLNGFLDNERIRIPLPESLDTMADGLRMVGFGPQVEELEVSMNRAAESAAGEATDIFLQSLSQMTLSDARAILDGPDTAATDYFRRTSSDALRARFEPIVEEKMQTVGLVRLYDDLVGRYRAIPLVGLGLQQPPEIQGYVTDHALDGLFTMLGDQEKLIRTDPSARVTDLLRTVFGS